VGTRGEPVEVPEHTKVGAYFVTPTGTIARRLPDLLADRRYELVETKNERAGQRIKGMVEIRLALRSLMEAERTDAEEAHLQTLRRDLNRVYDRFVKQHGHVSSLVNKQAMGDDPEYPLLHALERDYDKGISKETARKHGVEPREASAVKAAIFTKRVMAPTREITTVESAKDALVVSMNERGRVDLDLMTRLTGKEQDALVTELRGLIFRNPKGGHWETADQYLTGNVKAKLQQAREAATVDGSYQGNVEALTAVQPKDIEAVDIAIQLGSTWVPEQYVSDFITHVLGGVSRQISYQESIGKWLVKISPADRTTNHVQWGTAEVGANSLIERVLEGRPIEVKEQVGRDERGPIYRTNAEKTAAANQKADELRQAFLDWVWTDKDRRDVLARLYNDRFNTDVEPRYNGSHLSLPGASVDITLRPHQKDAIWRGVQDGTALFDHVVGAGKTMVCIGVAMESRRMGLARKPMINVPNHLTLQWKDAFYQLYPDANVLVAEKSDFKKENREKLFARIATGDWDAVIVGHSSFKKIGMPEDTLSEILSEQIEDLAGAIEEIKRKNGDRMTIKQMEKAKERMTAKMERMADRGSKDKAVTFDDLGVDLLITDEFDLYKNLFINTTMQNVSGLGNLEGSDMAFDLFVKTRYLQQRYDGRGAFGATGTPISNSIAEMYTLQRYMQYDEMKARGIVHFDAWASTFGQVVAGWELDATGVNYKLNSRFSKFQNVPELVGMYRSFADVILREDLEEQARAVGKRFPVPRIAGGKPKNIVVERSPLQAEYMGIQERKYDENGQMLLRGDGTSVTAWNEGSIIHRMENMPKDPRKDNPLKVTNDARKAGLDFRLINPAAPDFEGSKVNAAVDEMIRIYEKWSSRKGTQLVFCDLSTPKGASYRLGVEMTTERGDDDAEELESAEAISMDDLLASGSAFSVYDDIRNKLIARGVPASEIRYVHDAKTDL
ncbi:MAG: DEAD/DEAH box helicase family protein, partial [Nitrospiraceae bacterium]